MNIETISDLIEDYVHSPSFKKLAKNTQDIYQAGLDLWDTAQGMEDLEDYTPRMASTFIETLVLYKDSVKTNMLKGPKAAFEYLIMLNEADSNPFKQVHRAVKYNPRRTMWTKQEIEDYKSFMIINDYALYAFFTFLYETAQRCGDILNLKWSNRKYSEEDNAYYYDVKQGKTGTELVVWETATMHSIISDIEANWAQKSTGSVYINKDEMPEHIFTLDIGRPIPYQTLYRMFMDVSPEWVHDRDLHLHDLRRSRITHLIDAGYTSEQVMAVSGHTDLRVFEKTYKIVNKNTSKFILGA